MKSLDQYKDYEEFLQEAKTEGLAGTFKERQVLEARFAEEMDTRTISGRVEAFLKQRGSASRSELYRRLNLNRHPKVADEAVLRLHVSGRIYEQPGQGGKGRKGKVLVYGKKTIEVSDERYNELIARAGFGEETYTGSPNWIGPGGVPQADPLDQLIDQRKAS